MTVSFSTMVFSLSTTPTGGIPTLIGVSGILLDENQKPISTLRKVTFSLYDVAQVGVGNYDFQVTQDIKPDSNGIFFTKLDIPRAIVDKRGPLYLQFAVEGEVATTRQEILSVPYSLNSLNSLKLEGKSLNDIKTDIQQTMPAAGDAVIKNPTANQVIDGQGELKVVNRSSANSAYAIRGIAEEVNTGAVLGDNTQNKGYGVVGRSDIGVGVRGTSRLGIGGSFTIADYNASNYYTTNSNSVIECKNWGLGSAILLQNLNVNSSATALDVENKGLGGGGKFLVSNAGSSSTALDVVNKGKGHTLKLIADNSESTASPLYLENQGTGNAAQIFSNRSDSPALFVKATRNVGLFPKSGYFGGNVDVDGNTTINGIISPAIIPSALTPGSGMPALKVVSKDVTYQPALSVVGNVNIAGDTNLSGNASIASASIASASVTSASIKNINGSTTFSGDIYSTKYIKTDRTYLASQVIPSGASSDDVYTFVRYGTAQKAFFTRKSGTGAGMFGFGVIPLNLPPGSIIKGMYTEYKATNKGAIGFSIEWPVYNRSGNDFTVQYESRWFTGDKSGGYYLLTSDNAASPGWFNIDNIPVENKNLYLKIWLKDDDQVSLPEFYTATIFYDVPAIYYYQPAP